MRTPPERTGITIVAVIDVSKVSATFDNSRFVGLDIKRD